MFEFQRAPADLLGAEVTVYSDGALRNQHVSPQPGRRHAAWSRLGSLREAIRHHLRSGR